MNVLERDFFTDPEILQDPLPYYRALHERGPVVARAAQGRLHALRASTRSSRSTRITSASRRSSDRSVRWSTCRSPTRESWAEVIERRRHEIPMGDQLMSLDPPKHTRHRALVGRLFTPEPAQGERGVHVDPRRRADRRVRRSRRGGVLPRLREALHAARDRRPARGAARRPRDVPRLARRPERARSEIPKAGTSAIRCSRTCIPTSPLHRGAPRVAARRRA